MTKDAPHRDHWPSAHTQRRAGRHAQGWSPELHRYWTTRDRAANRRLFRLVAEVLHAIEAGVFHPNPGWACKDCPFRSRCWAWG